MWEQKSLTNKHWNSVILILKIIDDWLGYKGYWVLFWMHLRSGLPQQNSEQNNVWPIKNTFQHNKSFADNQPELELTFAYGH